MAVRVVETNLLLVVTEAVKPDCEVCRELVPPEELIQEGKESKLQVQPNFNGSNTFGTMKICLREG